MGMEETNALVAQLSGAVEEINQVNGNGAQPVPEHIAKAASGLERFAAQWADAIEGAARRQLDRDTRRYEDSMSLADQIRRRGADMASDVEDWAMLTREAGMDIRGVFERLAGNQPTDPTSSPA